MPARQVIPKSPCSADEILAFLGTAANAPELSTYVLFLSRYGGGHVFPNSLVANEPINFEFSDPKWSLQSFVTVAKNMADHDGALQQGHWDEQFRPIGRTSAGDKVLLGVAAVNLGQVFYWTPDDAGISYRFVRVADSFEHLLDQMEYYEDQGMTPPWNRMDSPDSPPAIALDLTV